MYSTWLGDPGINDRLLRPADSDGPCQTSAIPLTSTLPHCKLDCDYAVSSYCQLKSRRHRARLPVASSGGAAAGTERSGCCAVADPAKSLDARSRRALRFVYTILVELPEGDWLESRLANKPADVDCFVPPPFEDPEPGHEPLEQRPVVIGSGPAGLLAGYFLAMKGYRPLIIERGQPIKQRVPAILHSRPEANTIPTTTTCSARVGPAHSVTAS